LWFVKFAPVELIEAAPSAAFDESDEDSAHGLDVDAFVAVEDENLATEKATKSFDGLRFSGSGGTVWTTAKADSHSLSEG
jgi:hypothetical protein